MLYAIPIILATLAFGIAGGLVTLVVAVAAVGVTHSLLHSPTVLADVVTDLMVFLFATISVDRLRSQLRTIRELEARRDFDLGIARDVQQRMLRVVPDDPRLSIAYVLDYAREVGGDFYRFHEAGETLLLFTGDISGKGVSAALFATLVDEAIGDALAGPRELTEVAESMNRRLYDSMPADMFITMLFIAFEEDQIRYVNAGHVRPLISYAITDEITELAFAASPPLGVGQDLGATVATSPFVSGDTLLICSDGVTESAALINQPDRLESTFRSVVKHGPQAVVDRLRDLSESEGQRDDVTIICIRRR